MSRRLGALVAVGLLLAAACTDGDDDSAPTPTTQATTSTTYVDLSGVELAGVPGATTTSLPTTGRARITGLVLGPDGPLPGATVRAEHLVGDQVLPREVATDAAGQYAFDQVPGGRYRIRAFLPPTYAQVTPVVEFLSDREEHVIDLTVEAFGGVDVVADVAPDPPTLGQPLTLLVAVTTRSVGADGIVRATPVPGLPVELHGLGRWTVLSSAPPTTTSTSTTSTTWRFGTTTTTTWPPPTTRPPAEVALRTDGQGRAEVTLRCNQPGGPGLRLVVPVDQQGPNGTTQRGSRSIDLDVPACVDPAATTTAPPATGPGSTGD